MVINKWLLVNDKESFTQVTFEEIGALKDWRMWRRFKLQQLLEHLNVHQSSETHKHLVPTFLPTYLLTFVTSRVGCCLSHLFCSFPRSSSRSFSPWWRSSASIREDGRLTTAALWPHDATTQKKKRLFLSPNETKVLQTRFWFVSKSRRLWTIIGPSMDHRNEGSSQGRDNKINQSRWRHRCPYWPRRRLMAKGRQQKELRSWF